MTEAGRWAITGLAPRFAVLPPQLAVYATQFVVPGAAEEEHHFRDFAGATQSFQALCDRHLHGLILLWAFDMHAQEWVFQRGRIHFFDGKDGFLDLQIPPDVAPPLHPLALEDLMASTFDGTSHFAPDH